MHTIVMTFDPHYQVALIAEGILASGRHLDTFELVSLRETYSADELPALVRDYLARHPGKARRGRPRLRRTAANYERWLDIVTTYDKFLHEEQASGGRAPRDRAIVRLKELYDLACHERALTDISNWRNLPFVLRHLAGWVHTGKFDFPAR